MEQIDKIQELINKKAEKSLQNDLNKMRELYMSFPRKLRKQFETIRLNLGSQEKPTSESLNYLLCNHSSAFIKKYVEEYLDEYIEEESKIFIEKVDKLHEDLNDLKNEVSNIR